jgi:hypothetical protein
LRYVLIDRFPVQVALLELFSCPRHLEAFPAPRKPGIGQTSLASPVVPHRRRRPEREAEPG